MHKWSWLRKTKNIKWNWHLSFIKMQSKTWTFKWGIKGNWKRQTHKQDSHDKERRRTCLPSYFDSAQKIKRKNSFVK